MTTRLTDEQLAELERLWTETRTEWRPTVLSMGLEKLAKSIPSLLAEVRVARSSSSSGEREAVHAIRDVWLSARTNDDTPPGCYLVDSEPMLHAHGVMLRALSSAPPSPDSGERVRALEEALVDAAAALDNAADHLGAVQHGLPAEAVKEATRLVRQDADQAHAAARALSPQGDGGTER